MRTFTWIAASLTPGLALSTDAKLGQVVLLGEAGRGRHAERISLARRNPPPVIEGRVMSAVMGSFKLPARDGKLEKEIFFLEREPESEKDEIPAAVVRIKCDSGYRKGSNGHFTAISGEPKTVITGHGAEGLAGRAGGWTDSLVVMTEGDLIKVSPTCAVSGVSSFALWMEGGEVKTATWAEYERLQAKSRAEAMIADANGNAAKLNLITGSVSCTTYMGRGEFQNGIEVTVGATGPAVILGQEGRGRVRSEVPIVGLEAGQLLSDVAVVELSRKEVPATYYEKATVKVIYGLTDGGDRDEDDAFLVRVRPSISPHRSYIRVEKLRGEPILVARGNFASGIAGNAGHADDALYVLRPGDALHLDKVRVIENVEGELRAPSFAEWELADANNTPAAYIEKGRAPFGHVPTEWVGKVVKIDNTVGELVSLNPISINLGWDGRDRKVVTASGAWVEIQTHCEVRTLEGDELASRETAKVEQSRLVEAAKAIHDGKTFAFLESVLRNKISRIVNGKVADDWRDDSFDVILATTDEILVWNVSAQAVMAEVETHNEVAIGIARRVERGEILVDWSVWHREGGATDLGKGWVIRPDGSCREADTNDCVRRSRDGNYIWRRVEHDELAVSWKKAFTAAPHEFEVSKLPVTGLTKAQLETVERIERELAERYDDTYGGISGDKACPPVGNGWGLKPKPAPQPPAAANKTTPVVDAKPLDAAALKAQLAAFGNGRIKLGRR